MVSRACVFVHAANKYNSHFHRTHLSFIQFNRETFLFMHRALDEDSWSILFTLHNVRGMHGLYQI